MAFRLGITATLSLAGLLALGGCDDDSAPADASAGTSSTGGGQGSSSSSGDGSAGSSTGAELSTSSSGGGLSSSGGGDTDDTVGASDSDTDGPGDPFDCEILGGVLITEFDAEFPVFQVGGDDVAAAPLGTICMFPTDTTWVLRLQFGPMEGPDWMNTLRVRAAEAGTYDLASDFGEPGSGANEPNALAYALQDGASTIGFDTANQAADGTLQIDDWPAVSGDQISIRGDGNIAGMDGWRFQFSVAAVLP